MATQGVWHKDGWTCCARFGQHWASKQHLSPMPHSAHSSRNTTWAALAGPTPAPLAGPVARVAPELIGSGLRSAVWRSSALEWLV